MRSTNLSLTTTIRRTILHASGKVERIAGANRYETSTAVANKFFDNAVKNIVFAYALDHPDGLSGGPVAMKLNGPLILTDEANIGFAKEYAANLDLTRVVILGGPSLISDKAIENIMK
ncbi:MAG: cell wall-binding repeat-containing protein [Lachnospiraceae bacterium]|nr:cell wall-binding repeat-containing protein [Lachnospiraceae bacterium]